jgi:YD repeat-containing protein
MKRVIPFLLLLCLVQSLLFALEVRSCNSIGQDLGPYDPSSTYTLRIEGSSRSLYKGDEFVWEKSAKQVGKENILTTSYADAKQSLVQTYLDTVLMSEVEGSNQTYFTYAPDGKLQTVSHLENGELSTLETFFYDGVTHQIIGNRTISRGVANYRYFGQGLENQWVAEVLGDSFEKLTIYPNNLVVREAWKGEGKLTPLEVKSETDGTFVLSSGDSIETYNDRGLLVSEKKSSTLTEYQYDEQRVLTKDRRTDAEGRLYVTEYREGIKVSQQVSRDTVLEKVIVFNSDKTRVETLYDKGVAYCDVTYASDGMRVLSLTYR